MFAGFYFQIYAKKKEQAVNYASFNLYCNGTRRHIWHGVGCFFIYAVKTGVFKLGTEYFIERLKR